MNATQTLLPLVTFRTVGEQSRLVIVNPQHVVSVLEGHDQDRALEQTTFLKMTDGTTYYVKGDLARVRMSLQGVPWYAFSKLKEFITEADDYFDNRADADGDSEGYHANREMRLLSLLRTVASGLKEHGFIK